MLQKLRNNSHKEHWKNCSINHLIEMMELEINELKHELIEMDLNEARRECADIANFAAMIHDNISRELSSTKNPIENSSSYFSNLINSFFKEVYDSSERGDKAIVAERLGVSQAAICMWRSNKRFPRVENLNKMWEMVMEARK